MIGDDRLEVLGTNADVRLWIVAIAVLRALFACDLHHANLTRTAGDGWVAARFLKGDGSEEDGGDTSLGFHILEHGEVRGARGEGVAIFLEDVAEIAVDEVIERDGRRDPSRIVDTAVEPVLVTVGAAGGLWSRVRIWTTALGAGGLDDRSAVRGTVDATAGAA